MSQTLNFSNVKEILIGSKSVASIYRGTKKLWEKISKYLKSKSGNPILITDSLEEPIQSLTFYGASSVVDGEIVDMVDAEARVLGKNLLNPSDLTYRNRIPSISTGYDVTANGWATDYIEIVTGSNYILSFDDTTYDRYLFAYDSEYNYIGFDGSIPSKLSKISGYQNAKYIRIRYSAPSQFTFIAQIEVGSQSTTYEPYKAEQVVKTGSVNLFNANTVVIGIISDMSGVCLNTPNCNCSDYIEIEPNTGYFIQPLLDSGNWGAFYDKDKNFISGIIGYNKAHTSPTNAKYMRVTVNKTNNNTDFDSNFMVSKSSTSLPYEPYRHYTLRGINTVKDTLTVKADGSGELVQRIDSVNLKDLNWSYDTTFWSYPIFFALVTDKQSSINYFKVLQDTSYTFSGQIGGSDKTISYGSNSYVYIRDDSITDVASLKENLGNSKLEYGLATPITTQLTSSQVTAILNGAKTYKPNTTIIGDTTMDISYYSDTEEQIALMYMTPEGEDILDIETTTEVDSSYTDEE